MLDLSNIENVKNVKFFFIEYKKGEGFSKVNFENTFLNSRIKICKDNLCETINEENNKEHIENKIVILITDMENLHDSYIYTDIVRKIDKLNKYILRPIEDAFWKEQKNKQNNKQDNEQDSSDEEQNEEKKNKIKIGESSIYPIITISDDEIVFPIIHKENVDQIIVNNLNLDPRVLYWDSSIWNRYVAYDKDFEQNFNNVLEDISTYYKQKLYQATVCKEFLEFKTRQMLNSFLTDFSGGHAKTITPHKFHSETLMQIQYKKVLKKISEYNVRWRMLLIDDYADVCLAEAKTCDGPSNHKPLNSKQKIIYNLLENNEKFNIVPIVKHDGSCKSSKDILHEFNQLQVNNQNNPNASNKQYFDILLLDYLLGEKTVNRGKTENNEELEDIDFHKRETGAELLEKLSKKSDPDSKEYKKDYYRKGPLDKFWIFPISAFSYAMLDDLRERGISHHTNYWELATGADPVNTPYLFLYKFIKFLLIQIEDTGLDIISAFVENEEHKKSDLGKREIEHFRNDARKAAEHLFVDLNQYYSNYKKLLRNKYKSENTDEDSFASTIINKLNQRFPEQIWEHLLHLLYLVAFGSKMHWEEMWEEANYITTILMQNDLKYSDIFTIIEKLKKYIQKISVL